MVSLKEMVGFSIVPNGLIAHIKSVCSLTTLKEGMYIYTSFVRTERKKIM